MVKEKEQKDGPSETAKRRKTAKASIDAEQPQTPLKSASSICLYSQTVSNEEKQAKERNAEQDAESYYKTCEEINQLIEEITILKNAGNPVEKIRHKEVEIACKIIYLKKLNRLEKFRMKESRVELQKFREQVDNDHLQLQNLVYEKQHLAKEVNKCLEFKSIDEELDLVSVEEFYETAPKEVSKPEITKNNEHELRLARLTWELMKRKELSAQVKKLEAEKEEVSKSIDMRTDQLNKLEPLLAKMLEDTKPLQDTLNIPVDKMKRLHELAHHLPVPLYVLFVQAEGFTTYVKWLKADISGDMENVNTESHFDEISSDSDSDIERESSRRRKSTKKDKKKDEKLKEECLKVHPLSVVLKIELGKVASIKLEFQWFTTLEMAAVVPSVTLSKENTDSTVSCTEIIAAHSLLTELYPGDTGEQYPNSGAYYHLKKIGLDAIPSGSGNLGICYNWVQTLCGINFLSNTFECKVETCQNNIETTLLAIRNRVKSRFALIKEIGHFEVGNQLVNRKMKSILASFNPSNFMEFERVTTAKNLIEGGIVATTFIFYKATILSNSTKVLAYIAIPPNYPTSAPIFLIELHHKEVLSRQNSNHIRDVERELNVFICEEVEGSDLLLKQMRHFLLCTESLLSGEFDQPQQQQQRCPNFKPILGRSRSYPYKFVDIAGGLYLHR